MSSKDDFQRGFKARAEKWGISVRKDLNLAEHDPLDAILLAEHFGISIFSIDQIFDDYQTHPAYKTLKSKDGFNAVLMSNYEGEKIIIHNTNQSAKRQQSNLMHELAHVILKHDVNSESARIAKQYGLKYVDTAHENEAKYLGGCLQICRPALLWAVKSMTEAQMSEYYSASAEMVKYRLRVSGVFKQMGK
jgi:Zn-dependent peptidase ImmA (M78 family)